LGLRRHRRQGNLFPPLPHDCGPGAELRAGGWSGRMLHAHVALRGCVHVQVRKPAGVPGCGIHARLEVASQLPAALKTGTLLGSAIALPAGQGRYATLARLAFERGQIVRRATLTSPLTFVTCVTNFVGARHYGKRDGAYPGAIPSLWGLNPVRPSEPLSNILWGSDLLDRVRGELLGPCASGTPLTKSHRRGRAARWPLAWCACRSSNLGTRDTPQ
jgi:hypothetical protein